MKKNNKKSISNREITSEWIRFSNLVWIFDLNLKFTQFYLQNDYRD